MKPELRGVIPVIPIPFADDESIDESSLRAAVEFAATKKFTAMCLPAFGSEFYKLSDAERDHVVAIAIDVNQKRIPLIAQANHVSSRIAAELAKRYQAMGADIISVNLPRQFGPTEKDLLGFCAAFADAVTCPILIQDFNPGGATIDVEFIATLASRHPNVLYVKLEEPMVMEKLARVRDRVGDRVSLFSGWGGTYLLETLSVGGAGVMPGLATADLLNTVYARFIAGEREQALRLFSGVLPYLSFVLQNLEIFLLAEKKLLVRRGVFRSDRCRAVSRTPSQNALNHLDFLLDQVPGE